MKQGCSKQTLYIILTVLLCLFFIGILIPRKSNVETVPISRLTTEVTAQNVKEITVVGDSTVNATLKNGAKLTAVKEASSQLKDYDITPDKVTINVKSSSSTGIWVTILTAFVPVLLIIGFFYFMMKQAQGANMKAMSFGKTRAKAYDGNKRLTFKDVAGLIEPKQELEEVVDFLKSPQRFTSIGAEIPKGVLLVGPPGTGKTLMAKAVAGEAKVPFFALSASEFVEMFVGVGASRVRDLFQKAKRNSPCIVFIDELDAIGRQRGSGLGGSHDEREQTLNQILVEMDGFETDAGVIIMGATNRPDILDPALLRPGRFDRRVIINLPDRRERLDILTLHAKNKPLSPDVELDRIAGITTGLSGADLKNIINEAAILTVRANKKIIGQHQIREAVERVAMGPERKSHRYTDKERKMTAYHEAGHAIISHVLKEADEVEKITIIPRGMAGGYTLTNPPDDRHFLSENHFKATLAVLMGGWVSEEVSFNEMTTGASSDLKNATKIARDMVTRYGMSKKLGARTFGEHEELIFLGREISEQRNYSESVASQIDSEVRILIDEATALAKNTLKKYSKMLDKLAEKLLKEESVDKLAFGELFDKIVIKGNSALE
jgi:cell division protease FtsH